MTARASGERSATTSVFFSITQLHALALAIIKSPADFYYSTLTHKALTLTQTFFWLLSQSSFRRGEGTRRDEALTTSAWESTTR